MVMPKMPTKKPAVKQFAIETWEGNQEGEKIILYALTKMGKTTLTSLTPDPVFIGADDGGRKIIHPITGKKLRWVPGVDSFQTLRDVLHSTVFNDCQTIAVDNISFIQDWAEKYVLETISKPKSQGGGKAHNIKDYGYHDGYGYLQDTMKLLLADFDRWIRAGKNVILVAQETVVKWKTSDVEDFLMAGPDLHHSRTASVLLPYVAWADHVFRISYNNRIVEKGKVSPVQERAVFVQPDATFFAGARGDWALNYPIVTFNKPSDASIWRLVFGEKYVA